MLNESNRYSKYKQEKKNVKSKSLNDTTNNFSSDTNKKKFRWSSCFSSFITKFKKPKSSEKSNQQIKLSQSYDEIERKQSSSEPHHVSDSIEVSNVIRHPFLWKTSPSQQSNDVPPPSLSPPPRQNKSKRDSTNKQPQEDNMSNTVRPKKDRCPLIDPTLTPRVKPRSIKASKRQPSLLRLSLDAEVVQTPDSLFMMKNDSISTFKTERSSSAIFSIPHQQQHHSQPFRTGTLGTDHTNSDFRLTNSSSLRSLPQQRYSLDNSVSSSRPHSVAASSSISTTTADNSDVEEEQDEQYKRLSLKERRRRRSPLAFPSTEQLTLILKQETADEGRLREELQHSKISNNTDYDETLHSKGHPEQLWREQQQDQQDDDYSEMQHKVRQETMLTLEGKRQTRAVSLAPIANLRDLDGQFKDEKIQFPVHNRLTVPTDKTEGNTMKRDQQQLIRRPNNQTVLSNNNDLDRNTVIFPPPHHLSITPETPPYQQQTLPSLISAPTTPNSLDSSVIEDYINNHEKIRSSVRIGSFS
ncbi:MAG: hypothetical protein EXX96DRAFT_566233 [Benjaminiella poitrasii]|nr:MAG: hypothetical protein EXX96DRAFT_566233 [Benjaminiella poitrasii]